jgi:RNA polymerase sigma-70 factor (ECF subfamily)
VPDEEGVTDEELIAQAQRGERDAFGRLVERHGAALLRFASSITRNPALAEDAVQDALAAAWNGVGSWRGAGSVRGWLFAVTRNAVFRSLRRRAGEPDDHASLESLAEGACFGDPGELADEQLARREVVETALGMLSEPDRELLLLCDVEQLAAAEAAVVFGTSPETLRVRLHRARLRLLAAVRRVDPEMSHEG